MALKPRYSDKFVEAGCDEAGRGCLAGPVVAAAVVLPTGYTNDKLTDSKQLSERQREALRPVVERDALAWAVAVVDNVEIDRRNILHASTHAMCLAVKQLSIKPQLLLIDGNRFYNETSIDYRCIVKGDATYMSIAAASILAKTHRDEIMRQLSVQWPQYNWHKNKGYPTQEHYNAIQQYGITPYHRMSFNLKMQ
ncbi:MAG: ribonuclease HII [Bacteroidales bacterium]|nr:ribonuclease HII [Bacteroidales bacterium]